MDSTNKQSPKRPVAPPVYRPQSEPKVLLRKTASGTVNRKTVVAPPVYRPQPVPKVLQKKVSPVQHPHTGQALRPPVAPPIYRSQAKPVGAQAKMAANSQIRKHPVAPPVYRPQLNPNAARTKSVVQRYSETDIRELDGHGRLSENGNYFIPNSWGAELVYVATTAQAPRSSSTHLGQKTANSKTYQGYVSNQFIKDCLHTAEEINAGRDLKKDANVYSKVAGTSEAFGDTDEGNITLASSHGRDDDTAAPNLGQAYVIINKKWLQETGNYPYHAAAVVAVDGNDRITLEVFANDRRASRRNTRGKYDMYTTGSGGGKKFHSHWKSSHEYFSDDSATLVIEPKPDDQ